MAKTTYICLDCLHNGDTTECGSDGGDELLCSVDPENHKMFIPTIDKR